MILTLWLLTYHVRFGAGDAGGAKHSAIKGPPCSNPALSTLTVGTPSGTTATITITNKYIYFRYIVIFYTLLMY